ncbi:hypothetical protein BJV74DRAFT_860317 [Russula compacta]|nr:hypothetical protein BJV74DRAFT_860317 [Russula compacta]
MSLAKISFPPSLCFLKNKEKLTSPNSTVSRLFSLPQRVASFRFSQLARERPA